MPEMWQNLSYQPLLNDDGMLKVSNSMWVDWKELCLNHNEGHPFSLRCEGRVEVIRADA